jgi:hypothetical protein
MSNLKCITSKTGKSCNNLNHATIKRQPLDFETYSFCGIIKNYYFLSSAMTDRLIWIVSKLEDDYHVLCAGISYECLVIGTPQICGDANPICLPSFIWSLRDYISYCINKYRKALYQYRTITKSSNVREIMKYISYRLGID